MIKCRERSAPPRRRKSPPAIPTSPSALFPRSHISQASFPTSHQRRSPPSMRTTSNRRHQCLTVTADPRVVNCLWSDHQQSIHTLHTTLTLSTMEVSDLIGLQVTSNPHTPGLHPFPISTSRLCRHVHD
jgi:hypothetical protein